MKAISFNGGVFRITAVIVDSVALFVKISINQTNFKIKTGARKTHEVCWREYFVQVTKSSNFSDSEIIHQAKLQKYENNDLFVSVISILKSVKTEMWLK